MRLFWVQIPFSLSNRKHHCRHCGQIFCKSCCNKKRVLIKYDYVGPVRLCNRSYLDQPCTPPPNIR